MPGMNGIEVCRQIKANPLTAATPVIIMTGKLPRAEWEQLRAQGADGFMQKPFSVKQLLDLMDELTPQQP